MAGWGGIYIRRLFLFYFLGEGSFRLGFLYMFLSGGRDFVLDLNLAFTFHDVMSLGFFFFLFSVSLFISTLLLHTFSCLSEEAGKKKIRSTTCIS